MFLASLPKIAEILLEHSILGVLVVLLTIALIKQAKKIDTLYFRLVRRAENDSDEYKRLADGLQATMSGLLDVIKDRKNE